MARPADKFEALAREAAERISASRELQQQLSLLPDEAQDGTDTEPRRTRGAGRAMSQMREWLVSRGLRLPEEILAEMAGLNQGGDAVQASMAEAELVLAWAQHGAVEVKGAPAVQTMALRVNTFMQLHAMKLRAADALMPYGAPKASPDAQAPNVTQIVVAGNAVPAPPAPRGPEMARDVTPGSRRIGPPPMPHQMQKNQRVSDDRSGGIGPDRWTDIASD